MSAPEDEQIDALLRGLPWPDRELDDATVERVAAADALDDELEALLAQSGELRELWAQRDQPVSPLLLKRMEKMAPQRRRTGLIAGIVLAAAILIGVGVTVLNRGPDLPEYAVELGGTAKLTRSNSEAPVRAVFRPESRVRITLRPSTRVDGAPKLGVFMAEDGRLIRIDDRGRIEAEPGGVFIFSAKGHALFGPTSGRFTVYVAIDADPAEFVGQTVDAARADAGRWQTIDVEYQTDKE
jgi:hypothetical protein